MCRIYIYMTHIYSASSLAGVGQLLAERRRHRNLSHADVAQRCGTCPTDIRRLEEGRWLPSPSQAWSLGPVLGLEPDEFAAWVIRQLMFHPELLAEHALTTAA